MPNDSRSPIGAKIWNRKLHYYLGLYLLFFAWLFALTGLLLNHSWSFSEFWQNRKTSASERQIEISADGSPLDQVREVMGQLEVGGEIQWLATRPDATRSEFRVGRPSLQLDTKADLKNARATVQRTEVNTWCIVRTLHTFTGVRMTDPKNERDWTLTSVWALSMDAVAARLVVMVISGVVMWYGLPGKKLWGAVALVCGVLACGWFVVGLRWFCA